MFNERMAAFQVLAAFMFVDGEIVESEISVLKESLKNLYNKLDYDIDTEIERIRHTDKKALIENFVNALMFLKDYTSEKTREILSDSIIKIIRADDIVRDSETVLFGSIQHVWGIDLNQRKS